ncbi:hypothetical protein EJ02DRAFT_422766 [Clathrospora elynae]|uniref:Fungal N-terminal domain-containing protein n=1 Tax=Clathrospora elynae TaxID=706981 RepID=A0A6A5SM63_9PLEO|nr:hypothetical protein EJ02DRAFT_422766 [Clathrospora elynae]
MTATVFRITTCCVAAAKTLRDICAALKRAPITISSLCSQLKLTSASFSQIQYLLLNDTGLLTDKLEVRETFDTTVTACMVLVTWLDGYMRDIGKGVLDGSDISWKTKLKTMGKDCELKEMLDQLHKQHGAISGLLNSLQTVVAQAFECLQVHPYLGTSSLAVLLWLWKSNSDWARDSISEIRIIARRNEALLQEIIRSMNDVRRSPVIEAPESILDMDACNGYIFSKLAEGQSVGDALLENSFEEVAMGIKVYTRAFAGALSLALVEEQDEPVQPGASRTRLPIATHLVNLRTTEFNDSPRSSELDDMDNANSNILVPTFISPSAPFNTALENLHIATIEARITIKHVAQHPGELDLVESGKITNLCNINDCWYWDATRPPPDDNSGRPAPEEGFFERSKVLIDFKPAKRLPLRLVRALSVKSISSGAKLEWEKNNMLDVGHCIRHYFT